MTLSWYLRILPIVAEISIPHCNTTDQILTNLPRLKDLLTKRPLALSHKTQIMDKIKSLGVNNKGCLVDLTFAYVGHGAPNGELCLDRQVRDEGGYIEPKEFFDALFAAKITGFVEIILSSCFSGKWNEALAKYRFDNENSKYFPKLKKNGCLLDRCGGDVYELGHSDDPFWGQQLQITIKSACTPNACTWSRERTTDGKVSGFCAFISPLMKFKEQWMSINMKSKQIPLNAARWFEGPMPVGSDLENGLTYLNNNPKRAQSPVYLRRNFYKRENGKLEGPIFVGHWFCKGQQIGRNHRQQSAKTTNLVFDVTRYNDPSKWTGGLKYFDKREFEEGSCEELEPSRVQGPTRDDLDVAAKLAKEFGTTDARLTRITELAVKS